MQGRTRSGRPILDTGTIPARGTPPWHPSMTLNKRRKFVFEPVNRHSRSGPRFEGPPSACHRSPNLILPTPAQRVAGSFREYSALGPWLDWLAGAFYTHEKAPLVQTVETNDAATGAATGAASIFAELVNRSRSPTQTLPLRRLLSSFSMSTG